MGTCWRVSSGAVRSSQGKLGEADKQKKKKKEKKSKREKKKVVHRWEIFRRFWEKKRVVRRRSWSKEIWNWRRSRRGAHRFCLGMITTCSIFLYFTLLCPTSYWFWVHFDARLWTLYVVPVCGICDFFFLLLLYFMSSFGPLSSALFWFSFEMPNHVFISI